MTIRVLVIDDSPTMRAILVSRLEAETDMVVIGTAGDASEGRALIKQLDPDVITLDIEMPGMNGLDFLQKIMSLRPTPVVVVSSAAGADEVATLAFSLGAAGCYAKSAAGRGPLLDDGGRLAGLVREAAGRRRRTPVAVPAMPRRETLADAAMIAVGASTGGVEALQSLLSQFPADAPPTVIVQHLNPGFAAAVARTLDAVSPMTVQLVEHDMPLRRGHAYLAAADRRHLHVSGSGDYRARLQGDDPISGHVPSVDALFESVAEKVGKRSVGILLTGMGADGARGLLSMAGAGALTIAQDEASCAVFGMPRAAIAMGAAGVVAPLDTIARRVFGRVA